MQLSEHCGTKGKRKAGGPGPVADRIIGIQRTAQNHLAGGRLIKNRVFAFLPLPAPNIGCHSHFQT